MKDWFQSVPKYVLGPIAVILCIVYFTIQDPPKTVCDTQFEIFRKENAKYLFEQKKKSIVMPPGIKADIESCRAGNSPGACYDWMEGLKKMFHATRNLPPECGARLGELGSLNQWFDQSVFLFSQISWNDTPMVRSGLYNWLESSDVAMYCRLKNEYIRLRGKHAWTAIEAKNLKDLMSFKKIDEKSLDQKSVWERTVLSYNCTYSL